MRSRAANIALTVAVAVAAPGFAREQGVERRDSAAWRQWDAEARQQRDRIDALRREGRPFVAVPASDAQIADDRVRQAFDDPYLAPGDIIVTAKGLYRYQGTPPDRERQPGDFVRVGR